MEGSVGAGIALKDLTFFYPEQTRPALREISLRVEPGEFLVVCGPSGCGKSTLLRQLKPILAPHGRRQGEILLDGRPVDQMDRREQAQRIGFVQQNPEGQLVTDKVWHELAFGLESLGYDTPAIRRRVAEMAAFFGIQTWFYQETAALSGGQKQLLNLASVMVMQPQLLILDEPTSQLDPIASSDFLGVIGRINRELGTTIVLTEHRLEEALPLASRVAVMDQGELICVDTPRQAAVQLKKESHAMFMAMPAPMRIWAACETGDLPCPTTVGEGRRWLEQAAARQPLKAVSEENPLPAQGVPVVQCQELWFRYERNLPDVVKGLTLEVRPGELLALLGGNGAGKSTALKLLSGQYRAQRGKIACQGRVSVLPQDPQTLFLKKTLREDLLEPLSGLHPVQREEKAARVAGLCRLENILDRHPYDLSGGEQQRAALAKLLLLEPDILLLDEPTKGLDAEFKQELAGILRALLAQGAAVIMVSHDVEFCASYASRCALFFDGNIAAEGTPGSFFSGNSFYTTAANRMARGLLPRAVTVGQVIAACGGRLPPPSTLGEEKSILPPQAETSAAAPCPPLSRWRKVGALLSGLGMGILLWKMASQTDLSALSAGQFPQAALGIYGGFLALAIAFALCVTRRGKVSPPPQTQRSLSRRTKTAAALILLCIPLTLLAGQFWFGGRKYYFIALLVLLECMTPFFLIFEGRKPQARELVLIAALCALGVAGRAAFFMLPQFKPVMALTILAGAALGGETGFLVGAMTMLASNMLFAQGPWTPWQMFAMGIIGFLSGVLFRQGRLRPSRLSLSLFGLLAAIVIYGGVVNPASALLWSGELNRQIILTYYLTGFPLDCVQGVATFFFLWLAGPAMLEKLDRIRRKYGLVS